MIRLAVALSFGGFGVSSEELPRTADELKDFYHGMKTLTGKPMEEWYCNLIDSLSRNGGWEKASYEECKIRKPFTIYQRPLF